MERTAQALAAYCVLKRCSDIVTTPGTHARTCPVLLADRDSGSSTYLRLSKGCSSTASCSPLQRLWGNKAHTHACTHIHTQKRANTHRRAHAHTHAHAQTHKHTRIHTHAQTHRHTHTRTHTRTRAHTNPHIYMHTLDVRVMGFAIFPALPATLPHLSLPFLNRPLSRDKYVVHHCFMSNLLPPPPKNDN
jgi:hypothetical protein